MPLASCASQMLRQRTASSSNSFSLSTLSVTFFEKNSSFAISLSRFLLLLLHVSELLWRSFVVEVFQCYNSCRGGVNVDGYLQSTALPHLLFFSSPLLSFTRLKARARVVLLPPPPHRLRLLLTPAGARRRRRPRRRRPRPPCPRSRV